MNFTRNNQDREMYNSYIYSIGAKHLLTEAEQAVEDAKQKVNQALQSADGQKQMTNILQQIQGLLQTKYKQQYDSALKADGNKAGTNIEKLLKTIESEIIQAAKKQQAPTATKAPAQAPAPTAPTATKAPAQAPAPTAPAAAKPPAQRNESMSLEEGFFDRQINNVKGLYQKGKDALTGNTNNKSWKDEAILKRFASLKQSLSKELAELKADLGTTSDADKNVKDAVNNAIAQITTDHGISSEMQGLQKLRYNAGKIVQTAGTAAVLGAPIAAAAAPLAATVGLTGAAAAALTGGLTGGAVSMMKDVINGQQPNLKRAAVTGLGSALTAGLFKGVADHFSGHADPGVIEPTQPTPPPTPEIPTPTGEEAFTSMHGGEMDWGANMDVRKFSTGETLKDLGIMGTAHDAAGNVINVQSPIVQNFTDGLGPKATRKVMDYINNMDPAQREEMLSYANRKSGKAITELAKAIGDPAIMSKAATFLKGYR